MMGVLKGMLREFRLQLEFDSLDIGLLGLSSE